MRVMTDVSAERYWTVISDMEVARLEEYTRKSRESMQVKEFREIMKGCPDLHQPRQARDLPHRGMKRALLPEPPEADSLKVA